MGEELSFERLLLDNYSQFFTLIKDFGFGIIIFPSVVKKLKGSYFIKKFEGAVPRVEIGFKMPFVPKGGDD